MMVTLVESTGMFLAVGDIVGRPVDKRTLTRGLMADSLSTLIAGCLNTFPHTFFLPERRPCENEPGAPPLRHG
uniref:solute carrier family 23 protein n=1 Tax=Methylobacterium sp. B34 TaxID=95563 RepID=UPI0027D7AAD1